VALVERGGLEAPGVNPGFLDKFAIQSRGGKPRTYVRGWPESNAGHRLRFFGEGRLQTFAEVDAAIYNFEAQRLMSPLRTFI
jgi:hypothetical protein